MLGKILKFRKNTESQEKYFGKKGPHLNLGKKIRKNTGNQEKSFEKLGKILRKIRKNTPKNQEKYSEKLGKILSKIRIPLTKSLFPTMRSNIFVKNYQYQQSLLNRAL